MTLAASWPYTVGGIAVGWVIVGALAGLLAAWYLDRR